jgi:hypothetical protein
VSAGVVTGNGVTDILVGGVKGSPAVSTYDPTGFFLGSFNAFQNFSAVESLIVDHKFHAPIPVPWTAGVRVSVIKRSDGTVFGYAVGSGTGKLGEVRFFSTNPSLSGDSTFEPYGSRYIGGVFVG